jgi:ubiquinone/menaquinone biosynthesis C-methylase UbiE
MRANLTDAASLPADGEGAGRDAKREFFDALAPKWKASLSVDDATFLASALHMFDTPESAGRRVLDLGCGSGVLFPFYCRWEIVACDISAEMLKRSKEQAPANVVEFVQADAHRLPFPDDAFARVAMLSMLPHADDPERVLRECLRVLAPGGTLSVVHLTSAAHINGVHERLGGAVAGDILPDLGELIALLEGIGFEVEFSDGRSRYVVLCRKPTR